MTQEKIEYLIKKFHLKYSIPVTLTIISIYFWTTFLDPNFLDIAGVIINVLGLVVWWLAKLTLAENWNIGFGKPKINQLVTHSIYSKIRHPMYWGINLTFTGLILLNPEFWFSIISLFIIVYFFSRMRIEDKYLSEKLGKEYLDYKEKTIF